MHPLIRFQDVHVRLSDRDILNKVTFSINKGELIGLVGLSGAGKSTLFRLALGLIKPTQGQIFFEGELLTNKKKQHIGFASQENSFYPQLTIQENLNYFGRLYKLNKEEIKERSLQLLTLLHLKAAQDLRADKLSGGMKRRLDIALSLLHKPAILILDEPTTGLDILIKEELWDMIKDIQKTGTTVLVTGHNLKEIEEHTQSYVLLINGNILTQEQIKKIRKPRESLDKLFRRLHHAST